MAKGKNVKKSKAYGNVLFFTVILCLFGLLMCLSITSTNYFTKNYVSPYRDFLEQLIFLIVGFILINIIIKLPASAIKVSALPIFLFSIILLLLVLIPPFYVSGIINETGEVTKRWLNTPFGFTIQPSELAKLSIILFLASYFSMINKKIKIKHVFISLILIAIPAFLIFKEPNFSASILLLIIGFFSMIIGGVSFFHLFMFIAPSLVAVYLVLLKNQRLFLRVKSLFNVFSDPANSGYQLFQSFIAIARGGVFGKGFMKSSQKFYLLPESHSDFVFSVIAEEFGFFGAIVTILLFLFLFFSIMKIALSSKDQFDVILVGGIGAHIFIQAMMHMGVTLGVIPPTGIPLPFISTGGSALLVNLIEIGLVCNVARRINEKSTK
jgi:cell division protein FtsW